jgi:hypothetical protein
MRNLFLIMMVAGLCGCSIVGNLDEISTLQGYSKEKDGQNQDIKTVNDHYDALTRAIADGKINQYKDAVSFEHAFGEPLLKKDLKDGQERWLYRYAIYRLAKDKVYVYLDAQARVIKWEKASCPKFF